MNNKKTATVKFGSIVLLGAALLVLAGGAFAGTYSPVNSSPVEETFNTTEGTTSLSVNATNITNGTATVTVNGIDSGGNTTEVANATLNTSESDVDQDTVLFDSINFTAYVNHSVSVSLDGADSLGMFENEETVLYAAKSTVTGDSVSYSSVSSNRSAWFNTSNATVEIDVLAENITNGTASVTLFGANSTAEALSFVDVGTLNTSENDTDSLSFDQFNTTAFDLHYVLVEMDGAESITLRADSTGESGAGTGGADLIGNNPVLILVLIGVGLVLWSVKND